MTSVEYNDSGNENNLHTGRFLSHPDPGEEIIISGLAGRFPNSENVHEFQNSLFNKELLVRDNQNRWKIKHKEIPNSTGIMYGMEKFDAAFFGISQNQATYLDPIGRILLEKTFEAILDAGLHPSELKGNKTGVYIGVCFSDTENYMLNTLDPSAITGCVRSMIANHISYWLGANGPSLTLDTACSSSCYCLEKAYRDIRLGLIDRAIVGGCNLIIHPFVSLQFSRLGVLNLDGKCKCFDISADGYTRSEAAVAVILQKSKDARRVYCQIVHAKTNSDGYKENGITFPSSEMQMVLLKELYNECQVNPAKINYVEAHGTGTKVGDPQELLAIEKIFCTDKRTLPLMLGSVKCNIGHTEPTSGLCSVTKAILIMETGYFIPNINFNKPKSEIKSQENGRMVVVTNSIKWNDVYIPINNFGFGGANAHILLKSNPKSKINSGRPKDDIPRLVYVSGRTKEAVNHILDYIVSKPVDAEFIRLLHEAYKYDIPGHNFRGYTVLTNNGTIGREICNYSYKNSSLWFIFTGLGCDCFDIVADLMKIPIFYQTMERCNKIVSAKGIDLFAQINEKLCLFKKQADIFVTTTSIQISLLTFLKYIGIKPNGVIGYSIGEIACAFYDECINLEQALLCSYYLGKCSDQCKNAEGLIVNVEAEPKKVEKLLLTGLEITCVNWNNSVHVSGPKNTIQKFVIKLNEQQIPNEILNTKYAYHSSYAKDIVSSASKYLKDIVPNSKLPSNIWISSLLYENNSKDLCFTCSAQYLSSTVVNKINLEEQLKKIKNNAIILEISPKIILNNRIQNILHIPLLEKDLSVFCSIGKLYNLGYNPRIEKIYPDIMFPVSRGTSMISPLIKWNHTQDWPVAKFDVSLDDISGKRTVSIKLNDKEYQYITGHMIDERILYPATGYLLLVWESVAKLLKKDFTEIPVIFENVKFLRATKVDNSSTVKLTITIQKLSGNFEITESQTVVVTGRVYVPEDIENEMQYFPEPVKSHDCNLSSRDIYKELRLRGYNYSGVFCGLDSCDITATTGQIKWNNNWVAFMDNILQMQILKEDTRGLFVPTSIEKLLINVKRHNELLTTLTDEKTICVNSYKEINTVICGGVEIRGLKANAISRKKNTKQPITETYKFVPNVITRNTLSVEESVRILIHIILESYLNNTIKTTELYEENTFNMEDIITPIILETIFDLPLIQSDAHILTDHSVEIENVTVSDTKINSESDSVVIIGKNICTRPKVLQLALNALVTGGFILTRENINLNVSDLNLENVTIIAEHNTELEKLILLSKSHEYNISNFIDMNDTTYQFNWVSVLQNTLKTDPNPCIYSQGDDCSGIIGFINCLRREPGTENICCVFIMDENAPTFDPNNEFYAKQLKKGMPINILKNNEWGTYRHLLMKNENIVNVKHAYVNTIQRGDISSLKWLEGNLSKNCDLDADNNLVYIYYSALNFRDIMTASGRLAPEVIAHGRFEQECVLGMEFAGKLKSGRRVMGLVPCIALSTLVSADPYFLWDVPDEWTLEEAATVPVIYGTVLHGFVIQGKIRPGMSILIHSGTGGIGQAAINIALYYKCNVYVTVGNKEKREFIKKTWPKIKDNQIGNSRDTSFEEMIMRETKGRGVDIVINSLAEEKLLATVRCLASGGKFLEIGKFDLSNDNPLALYLFEKGISFHGVMLDSFFRTEDKLKIALRELVGSHIKNGAIKPLPRNIFKENEIEAMFRYMSSGKHMGKVLLQVREEESNKYTVPSNKLTKAHPRYYCTETGTHIIIGGLGGFGLELADWLIIRGARKIILTSRRGITTGYQSMRINIWKNYGVQILISTEDVSTYLGCQTIIRQALKLGPVETIFNLGVVLKDAVFSNQTKDDFMISFGVKAIATKHLDTISRELCPDLKQFVVFSSVSCGRGNAGQTNYGMSNSVMERICEKRHNDGLPAIAVEWGAIGDVGLVAELQRENVELVISGTLQQRISSCLLILDKFLCQKEPICASMVVAEKNNNSGDSLNIIESVQRILGITNMKTISEYSTLHELGIDSIMVVEMKQILERDFSVFLTAQEIRFLTFAKLKEISTEHEMNCTDNDTDININEMGTFFIQRLLGDRKDLEKKVLTLPSKLKSSKKKVILIPGIEGLASILQTLCSDLEAVTLCLQYALISAQTIPDIAKLLMEQIVKNIPDIEKEEFIIVSYSYGTSFVLELASLLEAKGGKGKIVCIDGSPEMIRKIVSAIIPLSTEEEMQNNYLLYIHNILMPGKMNNEIMNEYIKKSTWDEKLETLFKLMNNTTALFKFKDHCNAVYCRFKAILNYNSNINKLKSNITLIKPQRKTINMDTEDFGLSQYSTDPIKIHYIDGDHSSLIENPECSQIINNLL